MTSLEAFNEEVRAEFPDYKIVRKSDSLWMKVCDVLLRVITLNQQDRFMSSYTTTIGTTVYTPKVWEDSQDDLAKIITLRHERVHMRQRLRYGLFLYGVLYFLVLPTVLAFFRKKFEMEAYEESIRATASLRGVKEILKKEYREKMVGHFTSADYFWIWPFRKSIEAWFDEAREKVLREIASKGETK
jgi:hypothetical protein